jgi:RNA polymerase primary sigma factor
VHMGEKVRKITRTHNELSAELGRDPTAEEVAQRLGWKIEEVRDAKEAIPDATTSLNRPLGPDGTPELGDFVEDEPASDTSGEVVREMEATSLQEAIERLPERHRFVLVRRYGLDEHEPATLAELHEELKVSRERIRHLQRAAEQSLKSWMLTGGPRGDL